MSLLYPLKFDPVYKDYPWGNTQLPARFEREAPEGLYAESWEISTHPDGPSRIVNGSLAGKNLSEVLQEQGAEILGSAVSGHDFPLLIKLIDAAKPLSVQVHPNNGNAESVAGEPKTEMWYFLNEQPAEVYCGLKPGTTRDEFVGAIEKECFKEVLHVVPAKKGDAVFVPGGRVHAIDAGCLILEIQQNSNTTYRVYDWGRVGADGQPRDLHVEKALQVIDFDDAEDPVCTPKQVTDQVRNICSSDFFVLDEITVEHSVYQKTMGVTFHALFCADGAFEIHYGENLVEPVAKGTSVLIPASLGAYEIASEHKIVVLKTTVPAG